MYEGDGDVACDQYHKYKVCDCDTIVVYINACTQDASDIPLALNWMLFP